MSEATKQLYRIFEGSPRLPAQNPPFASSKSYMKQAGDVFNTAATVNLKNPFVAAAMALYCGDPDLLRGLTDTEYEQLCAIAYKLAQHVKDNLIPPRRVLPLAPVGAYLTEAPF